MLYWDGRKLRIRSVDFQTFSQSVCDILYVHLQLTSKTTKKQETVSVHQALNKEFLVDDTAIATHQISNKLDQLEKLVKKGESKSGHTLGEQTSNRNEPN